MKIIKLKTKEELLKDGYYENNFGDLVCSSGSRLTIFSNICELCGKKIKAEKTPEGSWKIDFGGFFIDENVIDEIYEPEECPEYYELYKHPEYYI
jgi:hypothetical protein